MSLWRFTLIDRDSVQTVVDNPTEWENIEVVLERDATWHGIFADYPMDSLTFTSTGALTIKAEYDQHGFKSEMQLQIEFQCSDGESYDLFYFGRLAFDEYEDECGDVCTVNIGLEDTNDIILMRNNYEQKVNLYNNTAFDETTPLVNYPGLNATIDVPARGLVERSNAVSSENIQINFFNDFPGNWDHMVNEDFGSEQGSVPVAFAASDVINTEIGVNGTQFAQSTYYYPNADPVNGIFEVLPLLQIRGNEGENLACYSKDFIVQVNITGNLQWSIFGDTNIKLRVTVKRGPNAGAAITVVQGEVINIMPNSPGNQDFASNINTYVIMNPGDYLWIYYYVEAYKLQLPDGGTMNQLILTQNAGSSIGLYQTAVCDSTTSKVSYINEALSRTVEAITNDKIRLYSNMFGRIDSEPYTVPTDSCAGLFTITNGLNLRRKLLADNTQPGLFVTLKQLFDELNAIWNIGLSVEPDPNREGFNRLRLEDYRFFYQSEVGIVFNYATSIQRKVDTTRLYNRMIVGYNKWEAGEATGLDEHMTQRTYRIDVNAISRELDVTTDMICSPYTIETTRKQSSGTQDYTYDNDLFGFCMVRTAVGTIIVETFANRTFSVQNINDPNSCYNGRVTPARNAMRWFGAMTQGYRVFSNDTKLIFSSGTGNYIAQIGLNNCAIDGGPLKENENLEIGDFKDEVNGMPIMFPEILTFDHPMNYNLFKKIKDDNVLRYKSTIIRCNDTEQIGWIKSIRYRPEEGMATIEAYPKNSTQLPVPSACTASIVPGSITVTEINYLQEYIMLDFTEDLPGATTWEVFMYPGDEPTGTPLHAITSDHPFIMPGVLPGTYTVIVIPYCDPESPSNSFETEVITIPPQPLAVRLTATKIPAGNPYYKYRITATPIGSTVFPVNFSFRFGECIGTDGTVFCNGYPSAPNNPMLFSTMNGVAGQNSAFADSVGNAFSNSNLVSVTAFALSGITPAQITKTQTTWDLNFE